MTGRLTAASVRPAQHQQCWSFGLPSVITSAAQPRNGRKLVDIALRLACSMSACQLVIFDVSVSTIHSRAKCLVRALGGIAMILVAVGVITVEIVA